MIKVFITLLFFTPLVLVTAQESSSDEKSQFRKKREQALLGGGSMGAMGLSNLIPRINFSYRGYHDVDAHQFSYGGPVFIQETNFVAIGVRDERVRLHQDHKLDSGIKLSKSYFKKDTTLSYTKILGPKKILSFNGSLGYAGDKITNDSKSFNISSVYSAPSESGDGQWVYILMMSNNSPLGTFIPVPGVLYSQKKDNITLLYGFPVFLINIQRDVLAYEFSLFGPRVKGSISSGEASKLKTTLSASLSQENYIPSIRHEDKERLTFEEKNIELSFLRIFNSRILVETNLGQSFDRKIYLGKGIFSSKGGKKNLKESFYFSFNIKATI